MKISDAITRLLALKEEAGDVTVVFLEPRSDGVTYIYDADFDVVAYSLPDGEKKTLVYMVPSYLDIQAGDMPAKKMQKKKTLKLVPP